MASTKRKRSNSPPESLVHKKKKKRDDLGHENNNNSVPFLVDDVIVEILTFFDSNDPVHHFKHLMQMRRVSRTMELLVFRAMNTIGLFRRIFPVMSARYLTFTSAWRDMSELDVWCERFVTAFMHFGLSVLDEKHDAWWRRSLYPALLVVEHKQLMTCWMLELNEDDRAAQLKEILDDEHSSNASRLIEAIRCRAKGEIRLALREYFFRIVLQYRYRHDLPELYVITLRPDGPDPATQAYIAMFYITFPPNDSYSKWLTVTCLAQEFIPPHETISAVFEKMRLMSPFDYCRMQNSDFFDTVLYK